MSRLAVSLYRFLMDAHYQEWLNLAVRWFHLIAGISWIGSSFYFMWLDASLEHPAKPREGVEGELWMVHSGGFYQVEKRLIGPGSMPKTLHWFKWEAAFTWLSGIFLLGIVYYLTGGVFLIDQAHAGLTPSQAMGVSVGVIVVSWLVYDLLWASPLADKAPRAATGVSFALLFGVVYGLCQVFSGRAAFVHVGAVLGTIMVANVWMRILPAQQRMIDATREGRTPDFTHGLRAKRRSVHNSYVTFPVLFMMLSNHFPSTYGGPLNWLALILLIFVGAGIRHVMIVRSKGGRADWMLLPVAATVAALVWMTGPAMRSTAAAGSGEVTDDEAWGIIRERCQPCHATAPTDDVFTVPPNGTVFEKADEVKTFAGRMQGRIGDGTMPLANKTGMTDAERGRLMQWLERLKEKQ